MLTPADLPLIPSLLHDGVEMRREGGACAALTTSGECSIYEQRPKVCRAFAQGGQGCLTALRR